MPIRPTGFDTPFGGVSWEYTTSPKKRVQEMFFFLESRRILYNPRYLETVKECVSSAIEIRECFVSVTKDVNFPETNIVVLSSMVDACNVFLDDLNKVEGFVPYLSGCLPNNNNLFYFALNKFRGAIKTGVMFFEGEYRIKFNKEITIDML